MELQEWVDMRFTKKAFKRFIQDLIEGQRFVEEIDIKKSHKKVADRLIFTSRTSLSRFKKTGENIIEIFISPVLKGFEEERKAAVLALAEAGHIVSAPAYQHGNPESMLEYNKQLVREADIYLLIAPDHNGEIDPGTEFSYEERQLRHALELSKPFFTIILSKKYLKEKRGAYRAGLAQTQDSASFLEFKKLLREMDHRVVDNIDQLQYAAVLSVIDIQKNA